MQALAPCRRIFVLSFAVACTSWVASSSAVTIQVDYSRDSTGFFAGGNPSGASAGATARAAMDAAAAFYSGALEDAFSAIDMPFNAVDAPGKFYGSMDGEATWYFKRKFVDPSTGVNNVALNQDFPADVYTIFVGARELGVENGITTLGRGGPGNWSISLSRNGFFTSEETALVNQTNDQFERDVRHRGATGGFGGWGGSLAFDINTNWHYNHTTNPVGGAIDFYSVALHELGHALGLGTSDEWEDLLSGTSFTGTNANTQYAPASQVPLAAADDTGHWLQGISTSTVFGGSTSQTPLMVPELVPNTRRLLTNLDAGALADLGWEIDLPGGAAPVSFAGGVTSSGSFGSAPQVSSIVPEPAGIALAVIVGLFSLVGSTRRRRFR